MLILLLLSITISIISCKKTEKILGSDNSISDNSNCFITGADVSYTSGVEENGGVYKDENGGVVDPFEFYVNKGASLLRLRIFHTPENLTSVCGQPITSCNLYRTLNAAQRLVNAGADLMITLHYGDYFNYPAEQHRPLAWKDLSHEVLLDSIYNYTYMVLQKLFDQNTIPTIITIGNETNWGFVDAWGEYDDAQDTDGWSWNNGDLPNQQIPDHIDADKFNVAFNAVDDFNLTNATSVQKALFLIEESVEWNLE